LTKDCKFPQNAFRVINNSSNFLFEHKQRIAYRKELSSKVNKAPSDLINDKNFVYSQSENSDD